MAAARASMRAANPASTPGSVANLPQHRSMTKERRILVSQKEGNAVCYRVSNPRLLEVFEILREVLLEQLRRDAALVQQVT